MKRSGQYISQLSGYKAFIPSPLPPNPPIKIDELMEDWKLAIKKSPLNKIKPLV